MPTRLGVVSYFNARPLVHALESGDLAHPFQLLYDVPSRCADRLHAGQSHVALIPSIEIASGLGAYSAVPNVAIASRGPVRSVLLLLGKDPPDIQTLAVDSGSRTSVALSRILLEKRFGCRPSVTAHPPDPDRMLANSDAALVIGDAALELDISAYRVLDLGEEWTNLTGLPFVYACWTGRPDALSIEEAELLIRSRDLGLDSLDTIAQVYATDHPNPPTYYEHYLRTNIAYGFGNEELAGLQLFYRYAEELGLIQRVPDLQFYTLS